MFILISLLAMVLPFGVIAADESSLTITVTPPLFQVSQPAGTDWRSQLRLVNSNNYDISVTVTAQDFHPDGETGNAVFEEGEKGTPTDSRRMSGWIEVPPGLLTIKRGSTAEIPFTIHVPPNADPGGHYGGLLVSTRPGDTGAGSGAGISSGITSLIFLRVPGDVVEKGSIRDFYTENSVIESPDARFVLRFENEGNVHIVPQGEIVITNMWGKVRGKVSINESSTFGNVLPESTRKFEFNWKELDPSPLEVGRYKAIATIVYGVEGRQTVERTVFFWIVPWKPVASILGSLFFFIWFISWSLRRYIKKALMMERVRLGMTEQEFVAYRGGPKQEKPQQPTLTFSALKQPLRAASLNLSQDRMTSSPSVSTQKRKKLKPGVVAKLRAYRPLIIFVLVLATGISLISWYFVEVFQDERAYHVEQIRPR
jgi:hypothetical protein